MKDIFVISIEDVQDLAENEIGRELRIDELEKVKEEVDSGLECWGNLVVGVIRKFN